MRTIVIVGASDKPERTSNQLIRRLQKRGGFHVIPVNPVLQEIEGLPVIASLSKVPAGSDVVSLYVGAKISDGLEAELERLKPGKVIFNPGAENPGLQEKLLQHGIDGEEACSLVLLSQNAL